MRVISLHRALGLPFTSSRYTRMKVFGYIPRRQSSSLSFSSSLMSLSQSGRR